MKTFGLISIVVFLAGCASTFSKVDKFKALESPYNEVNCMIEELPRRAVIKTALGKANILFSGSNSRPTWLGIPFIPFIPTFDRGEEFTDLRLKVQLIDPNGNAISGIPLDGWKLKLNQAEISGQVSVHKVQHTPLDTGVAQMVPTGFVYFEFSKTDLKNLILLVPPFTKGDKEILINFERSTESQYFGFAYGITHYGALNCPEAPDQSISYRP